jgi:predicted nucleic acid-binding protein
MIYVDTSLLMASMTENSRQAEALELLNTAHRPLAITPLQELELTNAVELSMKFASEGSNEGAGTLDAMKRLLNSPGCERVEVDMDRVFARARGLSLVHTRRLGTRSLDILHVAIAMDLGIRVFWSFDLRQKALASEVGLEVNP